MIITLLRGLPVVQGPKLHAKMELIPEDLIAWREWTSLLLECVWGEHIVTALIVTGGAVLRHVPGLPIKQDLIV